MSSSESTVFETDLEGLELVNRGKVRDVYDLGDKLLIVATDRLSAFDSVLASPIPLKGKILTKMAEFWFGLVSDIIPNHCITTDLAEMKTLGHDLTDQADTLEGRSTLVDKAEPFLVECVIRGYLAGSGWKEYQEKSSVCGIKLASGYKQGSRLPEPIFTPATKAEEGHDENISFEQSCDIVGADAAAEMRDASLAIYEKAREYAAERGIIIADTKFEFGVKDGKVTLIDEILTPDSSRFWPKDSYAVGESQVAFDKQFVRDYLDASGWDRNPPGPELPPKVIEKTTEKYLEAFRRLTGKDMP